MVKSEQINLDEYISGFFDGEGVVYCHTHFNESGSVSIKPRAGLSQNYLGGLLDADGCIRTQPLFPNNRSVTFGHEVYYTQSKRRFHIFEIMGEYLGSLGISYKIYFREHKKDENRGAGMILLIMKWKDVKKFLEFIYPHTLIKKPQIKIMLEEIIPRTNPTRTYRKYSKRKVIEIMHWVDKMNALKGHRGKNKYTEQYFRDLWNIWD